MAAQGGRSQRLTGHSKSTTLGWVSIFLVFAELIARGEDLLAQLAFMRYTLVVPERWRVSTNGSHVTVRLV